jgi:hypothetical protein
VACWNGDTMPALAGVLSGGLVDLRPYPAAEIF